MADKQNNCVFIVNPVAGNGSAEHILPILKLELQKRNISAEFVYTKFSGHPTEFLKIIIRRDSNI